MKGKGLALLAMLAPKKGEQSEGEMDEGSDLMSEGKMSAAEDILRAIKKGDAMALSDALEAHYACCQDEGGEEAPDSGRY